MPEFKIHVGDCLQTMRAMPDNSVDSIVTDPPYGLSKEPDMVEVLRHWLAGDDYQHKGGGFMGKKWDSFVPGPAVWREALRVLKPGGHLLAFFGTRTQDIGTLAIRLAGFEIRDSIAWIYGGGFPKSLDVSKAIDKAGATSTAWFGEWLKRWRDERGLSQKELCERCGFFGAVNRGGTVANWEIGAGSPTVEQFNKICEVLELPFVSIEEAQRSVIGSRAVNAGVAFSSNGPTELDITAPATDAARQWEGWGTALKPALEPITVARKPLAKGFTVAANVLTHGTGALNIDGCRVEPTGESRPRSGEASQDQRYTEQGGTNFAAKPGVRGGDPAGRWPANLIHDGSAEVVAMFPQAPGQQGDLKETGRAWPSSGRFGDMAPPVAHKARIETDKSAARFFYCAKTSRTDRNEGLISSDTPVVTTGATLRDCETAEWGTRNGNHHPTVKPTALMAYLLRLVTPPGGVTLDPFMGSGSTGKAAMREGFKFIGCEIDEQYAAIARARIEHEAGLHKSRKSETDQIDLFATT